MNTYVINLAKDKLRLAEISERLAAMNLPFERIEGIRHRDGAIGCAQSHKKVYDRIVSDDAPALVLEDDAIFRKDTETIRPSLLAQLNSIPYDVAYLGCIPMKRGKQITSNWHELITGIEAHAYIVNGKSAALKLIDWTNSQPFPRPWDLFPPSIKKVFADPILAIQSPHLSNVSGIYVNKSEAYWRYFDRRKWK